ncbi:MAG: RDD family protein [Granulosicoccus sp.]|nr:RDD family protein [Granulosicoccus sp.]
MPCLYTNSIPIGGDYTYKAHMNTNTFTIKLLLRRIAAFTYDCLLLVAIFFFFTSAALVLNNGQAIEHWSFKLLLIMIAFLFFDWFWRHGGQTLGMRAWRIQLVSESGAPITVKQTIARYITGLLLFGITLAFMFSNTSARALHDRFSKTIIVMYNK